MPDMDEICAQRKRDIEIQYQNDKVKILRNERKNKERKMYKIERYESKDGPRFRIVASNGKIIAHSEAYSGKGARTKTINRLVEDHNFEVKDAV